MQIIQFKRGVATSVAGYSGKEGEVIYNRTLNAIHISNGEINVPLQVDGLTNNRPSIISPSDNAIDLPLAFTLQLSPAGETVEGVDWKIYLGDVLYDEGFETGDINGVSLVSGAGVTLSAIARYRIRGAYTPWSAPVTFSIRNEWTTFFTASRETSLSTEFSRTTSHVTHVDKSTSYSAQTYHSTQYSYSRGTSHSTSYSRSTLASRHNTSSSNVYWTSRMTQQSTYGQGYTVWSVSRSTSWTTSNYRNTSWSVSTSYNTSWSGSGNTYYNTTKSRSTQSSYSTDYSTIYNSMTYYQTDYETSRITA